MNSLLLAIVLIPAIEIYLFIKIGASIGALNTVLLIIVTAFIGIYYAKAEGLNNLNQGLRKMVKNEIPAYELISGATIALQRSAAAQAISRAQIESVPINPSGPCCSTDPVGSIIPLDSWRYVCTSYHVISSSFMKML